MKGLFGVRSLFCSLFLSFMLFTPLFVQDIFAQKAMEEGDIVIFKSNGYYMVCDGMNSFSAISERDKSALKQNALWEIKKKTSNSQLYLMNIGNSLLLSYYNKPITWKPEDVNSASTIYNYGSTWYFPYYPQRPYLNDNNEWKFSSSYGDANAIFMTTIEEQAGNGNITSSVYNAADTTCVVSYTGGVFDLRDLITIVRTTIASGEKDVYYVNDESISPGENIKIFKETIPSGGGSSEPVTEYLHPEILDVAIKTSIAGQSVEGYKLTIPQNNTVLERSAVVNITISLNGETITRKITFTQSANTTLVNAYEFIHSSGQANAGNVAGLQQVHEHEDVIYALNGETKHLKLQLADGAANYLRGFYRWFDYNMDATVTSGLNFTVNSYKPTSNDKGVYILAQTVPGRTTYTMDGNSKKIACDISQYADYVENATNKTLIEPTLSYRMIYDIRPASEMAAKLDECSSTPLETYKILAPAGKSIRISPEYRWMGGEEYVNYYYTSGGNVVRLSDPQWYKNGALMTIGGTGSSVYDNRLLEVTASRTVGNVDVYELKTPTGLIIAQFNVLSKAVSEVGPVIMNASTKKAIKSDAELDKSYNLAAFRNFDFTDEIGVLYSKPMSWDESTYGFAYTTGEAGDKKQLTNGFADWSEYTFIRNTGTTWSWLSSNITDQSSGDGTGYFLYIDANEMPGKVADLRINGELCPNTSIWISTWIIDLNSQNESNVTSPNLNFIVTGIDAVGEEHQIITYTTGQFDRSTRGNWHQVLFEVKLDEMSYAYYRLRIDNNGASAIGNDFGIDNIRIYTSKPAVMGIQAMNACSADESTNTAILRVDFNRPGVMSNTNKTEYVYYRWLQQDGTSVLPLNYIGGNRGYGKVLVDTEWKTEEDIRNAGRNYYESLNDFLNVTIPAEGVVEFYTIEDVKYEDGTTDRHPVLYIVHNSEKFVVNKKYEAQTMPYEPDFSKAECTSKFVFDVRPRARILVDDVEQNTTLLQNLDVGTYKLSVRAFGNNDNTGGLESIDCHADWLTITTDISDSQKEECVDELLRFRTEYPVGTVANLSEDYPNLKSLNEAGNLQLGVTSLTANISKRGVSISYIAVPLASSSNSSFTICPNPLEVVLRAEVFIVLTKPNSPTYENMPLAIQGSCCVIRIPESSVEQQLPDMEVNYINREILGLLTQDQQDNLFNIVLCETNDAEYQSQASNHSLHVFNLKPRNGITHVKDLKIGDDLYVEKVVGVNFEMKPGKYYKFHSVTEIINGTSLTPAFNFDIYVVPSVVVWNPSLQNSAWHNDANWETIGGQTAFIPLAGTDVIIKGNSRCDVVLPEDQNNLGAGANQYLEYEIGVDYSSCNNIYFEAGAKLGRQHKLNYDRAYVDVAFDKSGEGNWEMISVPLKDVARGDFYIPKAGDGDFDFSEAEAVDNRAYNAFYMKAYNSNVKQTIVNDGQVGTEDYTYESAAWSDATSVLNFMLEEAHGYAINRICKTQQDFVRLPKSATEYYLFYDLGGDTEMELKADWAKYGDISRNNSHKLVYDQSSANKEFEFVNQQGDIFLIGNPFMTNLNVAKFFEINGLATTGKCFYYEYVDGELVVNELIIPSNEALRPLHAMFVKNLSGATSMNIKFTPEMMLFNESAEVEVPNKVLAKAREKEYISSLKILAQVGEFKSSTRIEEVYDASNFYSTTEDAELLVLDADLTPISLYSVVGNTALAYNKVSNIDMIPISLLLSDTTLISETFNLTFEGVDNFDEELYLYDTIYNTEMPLIEGLSIDLEMIESGEVRYYIRAKESNGGTITDTENIFNNLACVTTGKNVINVFCNETINAVELFDVSGRCIYIKTLCDNKHQIFVPAGIYMLQLNINGCVENHKVVVK